MDGKDIPGKSESFYSTEYGAITHKRITALYKSKLKAEPFIARSETGTKRGLKFSKDVLDKLDSYYNVPDEIEIVTHVTDVTHSRGMDVTDDTDKSSPTGGLYAKNNNNNEQSALLEDIPSQNNDTKNPLIPAKSVTTVTSVTEEPVKDHSTKQTKGPLMSQTVTTVTSVTECNGGNDTLHDSMEADKRRSYTCRYCNNMTFNEADHWKHTINRHPGKTGHPIIGDSEEGALNDRRS